MVHMRIIRTLMGVLVFALVSGFPVTQFTLVQTVQAEEEEQPAEDETEAPEKEKEEPKAQEDKNTESKDKADQDEPAAEPAEEEPAKSEAQDKPAESEAEEAPAEKPKADKSVSAEPAKEKQKSSKDEEQEKAEDAADEEVSAAQKAADEEEDAKAAEAEAEGAEVEVDESDEEEEPQDSKESPNRPAINGDKPVKETPSSEKRVIGATATIMEKQSELLFRARVDSGAKSCSLHIEDYKIENESDTMAENIGKVITFHIKNGNGESHWLTAKIAGYVVVKTAAHRGRRYKVPMTLRFKDFEKTVLVTLNNREKMEFPLLLGRNFLMGDFVVDVEVDNSELHTR